MDILKIHHQSSIQYKSMGNNKPPEATSVFDTEEEDGVQMAGVPLSCMVFLVRILQPRLQKR